MRALAIQQPFAWLVCTGHKRVENRSFSTPYRGRVAIVASAAPAGGRAALRDFPGRLPADPFTYGAYIGAATLVDVMPLCEAVEADPHASGPVCWVFAEPKLFHTPLPTKGKLNLYNPSAADLDALRAADAEPGRTLADPVYDEFGRGLAPDPFDLIMGQANEYSRAESAPDVDRAAARLIALDSTRPEGYLARAVGAYLSGRYASALSDCRRAIDLQPDMAMAYIWRADVHDALGDVAAGDADYARAVELNPSLADPPDEADDGQSG